MKIERVVVRGLRALRARDDAFVGPDGTPHAAVCLRGLNGSGKTTYLEAIAQLWEWFRLCTKKRTYVHPHGLLLEASVVSVVFRDLPGPRPRLRIEWGPIVVTGGPGDERNFVEPTVLKQWDELFTRAETGVASQASPPNIVWLEAEKKYVPPISSDELTTLRPAPSYQPVARYDPSDRSASHLEIVLRTLFLARRERWDLLAKYIGELRPGLELLDRFDETSQRPLFRLRTGEILGVEHLSAGERSMLINFCMILRWLAPGGIVLLDEPELHQHLSLMRASLSVLDNIITKEFDGQLIVASHAPEVWDHFRATDAIIDLGDPAA